MLRKLLVLASFGLLCAPIAHAQTVSAAPSLMNFQGRLATPAGNPIPDGTYSIRFSLWDVASGGTGTNEKWNQTVSTVQVKNGTFSVLLNLGANAETLFSGDLWLETKIGADAALTPRQQIVSVAYAMKANTVPDNAITRDKLASGAVTEPKIASNAVTNAKIASNAVFAAQLNSDIASLNKVTGGLMTATNSQVGVKTASPVFDFDVNGTFRASSTAQLDKGLFVQQDAVIGAASGITNPFQFSRVLSLRASGTGSVPTTTGITYLNATGSVGWSAGLSSDGNFNIVTHGGGNSRVVVPVLQVNGGSDVAEPFPVREQNRVKPGMVVSIDATRTGSLRLANRPYDKAVAGIVSGANGIRTGMTLSQTGTVADGTHPIALTGRVWCYVDADVNGGIEPGDLLTTSKTPGYAMKATAARRMQGATIGKAMSALKRGKGLVLVLVGSH
jgi:hypothetical protein